MDGSVIFELLNREVAGRVAAGVAVQRGAAAQLETVWPPASQEREPGFLAYSLTKTFTAVLLLLLQDEGRLSLDARLARWFPHIARAEHISLRQLLNHTAGIPDYGELRSYHDAVRASPSAPWTFERFAAETFDQGPSFAPGTGWAYSNPAYLLLKQIAEDVAERTYAGLIAERIAWPLELRNTFVTETTSDMARLAPATSRALAPDGTPRDVRDHYHPGWVWHGVVASSPSDIVHFLSALFRGQLVSPQSLREMTTLVPVPLPIKAKPPRWGRPSYGLGLMADPASPWGRIWGHNGGGPGYNASAFHAPDLGNVTVCAMTAAENVEAEHLVFAVLDEIEREDS